MQATYAEIYECLILIELTHSSSQWPWPTDCGCRSNDPVRQ